MALPKPKVIKGLPNIVTGTSPWPYTGGIGGVPSTQSTSDGGGSTLGTLPLTPGMKGAAVELAPGNDLPQPQLSIEDYMNKLQGDPLWQTGEEAFNTSIDRAYANMVQDPFRQALIAYGNLDMSKVPAGLLGDVNKIVDPTTLATAQQNPTSTMALLQQALGRGQAALPYQLQGQRSGSALVAGRKMNEAYQLQTQQALQQLLGVLTGGQGKWNTYADQQRLAWEQAKASIAARLAQQASTPADTTPDLFTPGGDPGWNPPDFGPYADYTPEGTYNPDTGYIEEPGGGQYGTGGGEVTYQSNKGTRGKKPLY